MKKVIVFGTFDIIHPGHVHMLRQALEYGDYLIIVVARDATVSNVKGHKPNFSEYVRLQNVKKLGIANKVILGHLDDKYAVIAEEKPDVVALGYDQRVFVENLEKIVDDHVQIVKLLAFKPEIYKSSKMRREK